MNDYPQEILALSEELGQVSHEFKLACVKYSEHFYNFQRLLGIRIMRMANKKPAIEKIISEALADDTEPDYEAFCLHYKGYEYYRALKSGLEAQIEAIKSKIMSRQSIMRYEGKLDTYGSVCIKGFS
jgi:hypothetical protein